MRRPNLKTMVLRSDTRKFAESNHKLKKGDEKPFSKRRKMAPRMRPKQCNRSRASMEDVGKDRKVYFQFDADILWEILFRVPIEALLRCQCVSKTWYGVIKNPGFISMHMNLSSKQPPRFICQYVPLRRILLGEIIQDDSLFNENDLLLLDTEDGKTRKMPIEEKLHQFRRIIFSHNGLLCIATSFRRRGDSVVICNPITKERIELPPTNDENQAISSKVGFCFVPKREKHIVVQALYSLDKDRNQPIKFYILTSGQRSWRLLTSPPSINCEYNLGDTIYWNNAFHWRASKVVGGPDLECIFSFDTVRETFQIISFPNAHHHGLCLVLLVLNGRLSFIENHEEKMKVWEVTGDKVGEFSLVCRETYDIGTSQYILVSRLPNNENLLVRNYVGLLRSGFAIASNDMKQYEASKIDGLPRYFYAYSYSPSLVSVHSMDLPDHHCS